MTGKLDSETAEDNFDDMHAVIMYNEKEILRKDFTFKSEWNFHL